MSGTRLCDFYNRTGKCRNGDACKYVHIRTAQTASSSGTGSVGGSTPTRPGHTRAKSSVSTSGVQATTASGSSSASPASAAIAALSAVNKKVTKPTTPASQSASSPPPLPGGACRSYWETGKCKFGEKCRYTHVSQTDAASSSTGHARTGSINDAPPGACHPFWLKGQCKFGDECKYRHVSPAGGSGAPRSSGAGAAANEDSQSKGKTPVRGFTRDEDAPAVGPVSGPGSGADAFFGVDTADSNSADDVRGMLRRYLRDDYRFEKTLFVYAMMKLLASASSSNKHWNEEDGQLLLADIVTENGLLRLGDILRWPEVSLSAGSNIRTLSFQRGYVPLMQYLASDFVVKSSIGHRVNALYSILVDHLEDFMNNVTNCFEQGFKVHSFKDPAARGGTTNCNEVGLFASLATIIFEVLNRFKNVIGRYPALNTFVLRVAEWFEQWSNGVSSSPPQFPIPDSFKALDAGARDVTLNHLRIKYDRIIAIVTREQAKIERAPRGDGNGRPRNVYMTHEGHIAALQNSYEGPGEERDDGPRHDNDFVDIASIRVAPTSQELSCRLEGFLPANLYDAPHPLPAGSMERLLDIQFRLLREELTAPLRTSIQLILDDLQNLKDKNNKLAALLKAGGGRYRSSGQDSVIFSIYTDVFFSSMVPDWRGMSSELELSPPPIARQKDAKHRAAFWERAGGKRLMQGGLVALVWQTSDGEVSIYLGIVSSNSKDIVQSAKRSADTLTLRIVFFDPECELRALQVLKRPELDAGARRVLVEAPVMYESVRPFLEALRVEPETIPFAKYLVHHPAGELRAMVVDAPAYARRPQFKFQLASLFNPDAGVADLQLSVTDPASIEHAREVLKAKSRLDPSQADAVVNTLTREVALIQGPPGTGKSYTGVELIRVLLKNKVGPILLIALTNHALDSMLHSVLSAQITTKVVRLGSRSADEMVAKYSLENMEVVAGKSRLDRTFGRDFRNLKTIEENLKKLMIEFLRRELHSSHIIRHLEVQYPEEHELLVHDAPAWVVALHELLNRDSEGWNVVGDNKEQDRSIYAFWRSAQDLQLLESKILQDEPTVKGKGKEKMVENRFDALATALAEEELLDPDVPPPSPDDTPIFFEEEKELEMSDLRDVPAFFRRFDVEEVPVVPATTRNLNDLLQEPSPWMCSRAERDLLHAHWSSEVKRNLEQQETSSFRKLREEHASALAAFNEGKVEVRRQLLKNVDIIGATTTGASKLTTLLKGIGPRILLVEEAGQVLEAHILASLVPSVEHLICIGDPLQLRPNLTNYSLSMDNKRGAALFRFDMSLMERLATELQMSQIDVQRRMRPSISSLIRNTLYPRLQDHDIVKHYPPVQGMPKNVFFLHHENKENGEGDESGSKYNSHEVAMVKDLVLYFLRQGCYSNEGDIVVLCAYLGQLARLREALAKEVAVLIDERDEEKLVAQEDDAAEAKAVDVVQSIERVQVSRRVRLRTVDNYQGEEGKIVILSLVRNSGAPRDGQIIRERATIGFLASENRTNVALSRAKHGLYIIGNAQNLSSRSPMWRTVIEELETRQELGEGIPVACNRHPETTVVISKPGELPRFAPDGGCLLPCESRLGCGHQCPYKCHSDDPRHLGISCAQPCTRHCSKGHPCTKQCSEDCGLCRFPISNIQLPCGHIKSSVHCHQTENLQDVPCTVIVTKKLPFCEHVANMACSANPAQFPCKSRCDQLRVCCGKPCTAACSQCQSINRSGLEDMLASGPVQRKKHAAHACEKTLYCGHRCDNNCSEDHSCTAVCTKACRQECSHTVCREPCSTPCAPCQQPCAWICKHQSCPVPCGSVCARLPCDERCERMLPCNHRCPSVCGEDCAQQCCPECATLDEQAQVVDFILYRTLDDLDPDQGTLDELTITLACKHTFTVETLDGHCQLADYYSKDAGTDKWDALLAPSSEFRKPPVCPTCRAQITALRYGRAVKRANLDILETNVASRMVRSLNVLHTTLEQVDKPAMLSSLIQYAGGAMDEPETPSDAVISARARQREKVLATARAGLLPDSFFDPSNKQLHGALKSDAKAWRQATTPLFRAYTQAVRVTTSRSSHIHAWESAFSNIFNHAMDQLVLYQTNDADVAAAPTEFALRFAHQAVGQPKPAADSRYRVRAICTSISIRLALADIAYALLEALGRRPQRPAEQCRMWAAYATFVLRTCTQDTDAARTLARGTASHRQAAEVVPLAMQAELRMFSLSLLVARQQGRFLTDRDELLTQARMMQTAAARVLQDTVRLHRAARGQAVDEEEWLDEHVLLPVRAVSDEWTTLERSISMDTFYQPVARDELVSIVKALNFGTVGHFYRCPNGHAYVITECGGAMERSQCPECGSEIGGGSHRLLENNTRDLDMQALAREAGARNEDYWAPR